VGRVLVGRVLVGRVLIKESSWLSPRDGVLIKHSWQQSLIMESRQ
jgi:hypothetical protein